MMKKKAYVSPEIKADKIMTDDIIMVSGYTESLKEVTLGVAEIKFIDIN